MNDALEHSHDRGRTRIWKSTELRRRLADAGLVISAGKMSALWTGKPTTVRLDDLDVICAVLECEPERPVGVRSRTRSQRADPARPPPPAAGVPRVTPTRLGRNRTTPPA